MTIIVFEKNTPQSKVDWHVARLKPNLFFTGVPPKWEARAIAEDWTFPYVVPEADIEGVE